MSTFSVRTDYYQVPYNGKISVTTISALRGKRSRIVSRAIQWLDKDGLTVEKAGLVCHRVSMVALLCAVYRAGSAVIDMPRWRVLIEADRYCHVDKWIPYYTVIRSNEQ